MDVNIPRLRFVYPRFDSVEFGIMNRYETYKVYTVAFENGFVERCTDYYLAEQSLKGKLDSLLENVNAAIGIFDLELYVEPNDDDHYGISCCCRNKKWSELRIWQDSEMAQKPTEEFLSNFVNDKVEAAKVLTRNTEGGPDYRLALEFAKNLKLISLPRDELEILLLDNDLLEVNEVDVMRRFLVAFGLMNVNQDNSFVEEARFLFEENDYSTIKDSMCILVHCLERSGNERPEQKHTTLMEIMVLAKDIGIGECMIGFIGSLGSGYHEFVRQYLDKHEERNCTYHVAIQK